MRLLRSLAMCFLMYSRIPAPKVEWKDENMAYAMCFFPLVGLIEGVLLYLWYLLCRWLGIGPLLFAAGAVGLPIAVNGGIHLDGFCDCSDALASHQTRERKLEIMKDSSAGAFAVIACGVYLILFFALWGEEWAALTPRLMGCLALGPVLSRALSGFGVVTFRNARTGGLLATFSRAADSGRVRVVMILWYLAALAGAVALSPWPGTALVLGALATFLFYRVSAYRQFGGITGDTAGWFLQLCELVSLAAAVLAGKLALL